MCTEPCHIEIRLMPGDELKLCYHGELHKRWEGVGHVSKMPSSIHNVVLVCVVCT